MLIVRDVVKMHSNNDPAEPHRSGVPQRHALPSLPAAKQALPLPYIVHGFAVPAFTQTH